MSDRLHHTSCPVCGSASIQPVLQARDYTVSGEIFSIAECASCTVRFTQDIPGESAIGSYYKSEDYISHSNTKRGLINHLYQWVRKRTMRSKRKLVEQVTGKKSGNLLDVGSGTGSFVNEMQQHGWTAKGLEPDAGARKTAGDLYQIALEDTSQFHALPAGQFDAITLWHVLEHVHDLHGYIHQLKNLLNEQGNLLIAVPNYTSFDAAAYVEYWAAYDVPRHLYHFSPASMRALMDKHGLHIRQYKPMWYDSFYISLVSSRYRSGKPSWLPAVWTGLRSNLNALGNTKKCSSIIYIVSKHQ